MPLIVVLVLICVVIAIFVVGENIGHPTDEPQISEIPTVIEEGEEILASDATVEHVCSNYYVSKYDATNHWNECSICGQKYDVVAHTYIENWTMGESCSPANKCNHVCLCGYSYQTNNTREHDWSTTTDTDKYAHSQYCTNCKLNERTRCTKEDGSIISCSNLGTCTVCKNVYSQSKHHNYVSGNGNAICSFCDAYIGTISNLNINIENREESSLVEISYDFSVDDTGNIDDLTLGSAASIGGKMESQTKTENNSKSIHIVTKFTFPNYETTVQPNSMVKNYYASTDIYVSRLDLYFPSLSLDTNSPVINPNIVQTNLATSNGWATQKQLTVSGTENFCSSVKITLKDSEGNTYLNNAATPVTNNGWSYTFVPDIEASEAGKQFTITVTDNLGNSAEKTFIVEKTDKKAPTITSEAETSQTWTKTKAFTFTATDEGSGGVSIAINNANDYTLATKSGTTYSRAHTFTEEIYGSKNVTIYFKDALGNATTQNFKVYNIDSTKPTITKQEIINNEIVLTGNDKNATLNAEGSGIAKYRYLGSSEENITIGETTGKETTSNKIPLTEFERVKYVYIGAIDKAGNISNTVKVVLPTYKVTVNPNGGTWRGKTTNTDLTGYNNKQTETIENPTREGYTFTGWTASLGTIADTTYTFGLGNATLTANWKAIEYTITYELNGGTITGNPSTYTIATENFTLNNPTRKGYTFTGWTGTDIETKTKEVTITKGTTGNRQYTANWEVIGYTITYELNGGTVTGNPTTYTVETETFTLNNPTKAGYNFTGWTGSNGETPQTTVTINKGSTENKSYIANWTEGTDTPYTIKHWKQTISASEEGRTEQNENNYTEVEEDRTTLQGTTGTQGTGNVKEYIGFTSPEQKTITIAGDGSAVLNYYYTRNKYKLTLREGKGISEALATEMENENREKTYPYDKNITINAKVYVGYAFDKWEGNGLKNEDGTEKTEINNIKYEFKMPANDVEYEAKATPNTDTTYTINHWTQKIEGTATDYTENSYKLEETEILKGETDTKVSPQTKEYEGFKAPKAEEISEPITGDGTLVINYYYTRRTDLTCTIKYIDKDTGEIIREKTLENQVFESEINLNEEIIDIENYTYENMEPETIKIGTGENLVNIYYVAKQGKITVHHYIYDEENNKYTEEKLTEDEEIIGKIGENYETKPSSKIPANYKIVSDKPEGYEGTIETETKEISYYYQLIKPKTEGKGKSELISGGTQDENGNWTIKKGEEAKYVIEYEVKIEDYIGDTEITIVAKLPEGIDPSKSDLAGGIYDEKTNTITWIEKIENINTFENGTYEDTIRKEITLVYKEDVKGSKEDINLKIEGNIETYYPDGYPGKGGQAIPKKEDENKPDETPEKKQGKVIVRYVDIETENGAYAYEITGTIGEQYETEAKEIKYYTLVKTTENTKGEITEEPQVVTYYYRKLNFNIGIEKTIDTITLNGQDIKITNKELAKIEIKKDEIKNTELIIKYKIKVTNTGELGGTATIEEQIPQGYEFVETNEGASVGAGLGLPNWQQKSNGNLETDIDLEAGESKELEIALRWENTEENLGAKTSKTKIEETKNTANFKDTNEEDNIGEATIIVNIKTGEVVSNMIIMIIVLSLGICTFIIMAIKNKKGPNIKDIKFLK